MNGKIALDSTIAIRILNGEPVATRKILLYSQVILPIPVIGELLFGAENSQRRIQNHHLYMQFIEQCFLYPIGLETAKIYSRIRADLKRKGRPLPENDIWIAAQSVELNVSLVSDDSHFKEIEELNLIRW